MRGFEPDSEYFLDVLLERKEPVGRVPLFEISIDGKVVADIFGIWGEEWRGGIDDWIKFYRYAGYDCYIAWAGVSLPHRERISHVDTVRDWASIWGVITSWEEFDRYPWDEVEGSVPENERRLLEISERLPEGMGMVVVTAGPFEPVMERLMGYEVLFYLLYDDPALVHAVFDRLGGIIERVYRIIADIPGVVAVCHCDDMGFKTSTLISPEHLRQLVLPWHKRYADIVHSKGLPFFLHSCGNVEAIMPDWIEEVGIDARHSSEGGITPVWRAKELYGKRIAVLGGVDVDKLARWDAERLSGYIDDLLERCVPGGGYALGSGNSIPAYIPAENYLLMLEKAQTFLS